MERNKDVEIFVRMIRWKLRGKKFNNFFLFLINIKYYLLILRLLFRNVILLEKLFKVYRVVNFCFIFSIVDLVRFNYKYCNFY